MVTGHRHFRWASGVLALLLCGVVVLAPSPARAETSYHKLKKRLRRLERNTGAVLEDLGDYLSSLPIEFGFPDDDDESTGEKKPAHKTSAPTTSAKVKHFEEQKRAK